MSVGIRRAAALGVLAGSGPNRPTVRSAFADEIAPSTVAGEDSISRYSIYYLNGRWHCGMPGTHRSDCPGFDLEVVGWRGPNDLVGGDERTRMSQLETFECRECGESFQALPESNAATKRCCSPACETAQLAV